MTSKKPTRKQRLEKAQEELDNIITVEVLEEAREMKKVMTREKPEDYWRKLK